MSSLISDKSDITIVTGYFTIPSKFSNEKYQEWIKNFLSLNCNMIIFTDSNNYDKINEMRNDKNTKIIKIDLFQFETWKYFDYWKYCKSIDREEYHTIELYLIWAEKTFFLEKAIQLDPFQSKLFFWSDMGCIRDEKMLRYLENFPNFESFKDYDLNKFFLSCIHPFKPIETVIKDGLCIKLKNDGVMSPEIFDRIQGGFLGGSKESIKDWVEMYLEELNFFMKNGYFGGKDQYIFINIYLKNKEKFNLLPPIEYQPYFNVWFSYLKRFA